MRGGVLLLVLAVSAGCPKPGPDESARVTLHRTGGSTFELEPGAGQPPYCLVYTVASNGLLRQLTMSAKNVSFACPAGQPIGKRQYRVPLSDGPVKVLVLFTSQEVHAGSVSQQLVEATDRLNPSVLNLRLPGNAVLATVPFEPSEDVPVAVGNIIGGSDAGVAAAQDAGAPAGDGASAVDGGAE